MKIVFLDMDGVLCTIRSHTAQNSPAPRGVMQALDREAVGLINILMVQQQQAVRCVLTSTWRFLYSRHWIDGHLHRHGWEGQFHDDWKTGVSPEGEVARGREIKEWLSRHPEITDYVIFDDNPNMLPEQQPFFVQTHPHNGILWADFQKAASILYPQAQAQERAA
jgi:hypothetical protein